MPTLRRLKHSFTAGEVSPLMTDRVDFERHINGCLSLKNMLCLTQGPITRRPGFRYIYDLSAVGLHPTNPIVRMIPFVFNELQAYALIFFMHSSGTPRVVFGYDRGLVTDGGSVVYLSLTSAWDIENFDWAQSGDTMYCAQSGVAPHYIQRTSHTSWSLVAVTFVSQPADWSVSNGWPERVTFHQQRLVYGTNTLRRQTLWSSKAGSFHDFGVHSPLLDSDALTFTLDSGTQNKIKWLSSAKALYVGTMGNEWTVTGSTKDALTPSNILAQRQTSQGSEGVKPLMVGDRTLFIEQFGRIVNEFVYNYALDYSGGFETNDLTILAPHLTKDYSVHSWAYQQTPHSIIWCVREDGGLIALTYQRQHKVIGWHRHDTDGQFKTVCTIPGQYREDTLWAVVARTINGSVRHYVEQLDVTFNSDSSANGRFLDSFIEYSGAAATTFSGLSHLEGKTVHIIADGAVEAPRVVTSGQVSIPYAASNVAIGLNYESEVIPCVADVTMKDGTLLGRKQRVIKIDVELYRSLGISYGRETEDGRELLDTAPFRRSRDLLGQAVPLFTGIRSLDFVEGWDTKSKYFLRQTQPLPMTILGIIDHVEVAD